MTIGAALLPPSSAEWTAALDVVPHDAYHVPAYVAMEARSMGGVPVAFSYREGNLWFLLPLIFREVPGASWKDAVSPYGYPGVASNAELSDERFWDNACLALISELRAAGALTCFIRMNSLLPFPPSVLQRVGALVQHGHTVALDLALDYEQMWAKTRSNHRRQIKRTRELGMRFVVDDWGRVGEFVELYLQTMQRVGASEFYWFDRNYLEELRAALGPNVHLLLIESADGVAICGGVFLERDGIVQYHLGGTRDDSLHFGAAKQLFDEVRTWAKERGDSVLHLQGGTNAESSPLFHFKAGFSDWHPPLHTWRIVTDRTAYAEVTAELAPELDSSDDTQFFPAYRAPHPAAHDRAR